MTPNPYESPAAVEDVRSKPWVFRAMAEGMILVGGGLSAAAVASAQIFHDWGLFWLFGSLIPLGCWAGYRLDREAVRLRLQWEIDRIREEPPCSS